jgi:hypothetical protein
VCGCTTYDTDICDKPECDGDEDAIEQAERERDEAEARWDDRMDQERDDRAADEAADRYERDLTRNW